MQNLILSHALLFDSPFLARSLSTCGGFSNTKHTHLRVIADDLQVITDGLRYPTARGCLSKFAHHESVHEAAKIDAIGLALPIVTSTNHFEQRNSPIRLPLSSRTRHNPDSSIPVNEIFEIIL